MYENTKARDATVKGRMRRTDQPRILSGVCRSLLRVKPGVFRKEDEAAAAEAACQRMNREMTLKRTSWRRHAD